MNLKQRLMTAAVTLSVSAGMFAIPMTARASEEGRKNTALALGAAAVGLLLTQKNKVPGIVAGVGAAYAYKRYNDAVKDRHDWERYGYYDGYRYGDNRYNDNRYSDNRYDRYDRNDRYDRYDRYDSDHRYNRDDRDRYDRRDDNRYYARGNDRNYRR